MTRGRGGGSTAPTAPVQMLRAIARHASPEAVAAAEMDEAAQIRRQSDAWVAAGRPGAVSHEAFRKVLLGDDVG